MARRKLKHFAEMKEMAHVFEPTLAFQRGEKMDLRGSWGPRVVLELACGGGDYTLALAQRFPTNTVIGVDIKGSRMWFGAQKAADLKVSNAKFLRTQIANLGDFFADGEVDEIWITFPNPHPTKGNAKRRLTSRRFLEMYRRILKPGGLLHLKTDDAALFEFSKEMLPLEGFMVEEALADIYGAAEDDAMGVDSILTQIQTQYEKKYLAQGRTIKYLRGVSPSKVA
ncbi:MAG: tRNA (guanosine(46)-N7)-methyltransferase TrmB [Candidatus Gracilibacteria bacterium]|jgi:tRNA (guanine-N7-)-methyltransferase